MLDFNKKFSENISDNLIHNRLNIKYEPLQGMKVSVDLRNRLIWGEHIKMLPSFSKMLKNQHDFFDLQQAWVNNKAIILHTNVERINLRVQRPKWNLRLGRQRINWSMSTIWNPNDLFNAYNFLDIDYEERPGADAINYQYFLSSLSDIQLTYAKTRGKKDILALRYFLNTNAFDVQLLAALYRGAPSFGLGWAGNIGEAGFRGELQHYFLHNGFKAHTNISVETDYAFENSWYVDAGFLYNSLGIDRPVNNFNDVNLELSAENLMPAKWNFLCGFRKEITPLWSTNFSTIYSPGMHFLILVGGMKYSIANNLDMDVFGQSFFAMLQNQFQATQHLFYLRVRWSF